MQETVTHRGTDLEITEEVPRGVYSHSEERNMNPGNRLYYLSATCVTEQLMCNVALQTRKSHAFSLNADACRPALQRSVCACVNGAVVLTPSISPGTSLCLPGMSQKCCKGHKHALLTPSQEWGDR